MPTCLVDPVSNAIAITQVMRATELAKFLLVLSFSAHIDVPKSQPYRNTLKTIRRVMPEAYKDNMANSIVPVFNDVEVSRLVYCADQNSLLLLSPSVLLPLHRPPAADRNTRRC